MPISETAFETLKSEYDSSWAIWASEERKVIGDSVSDMSVFDLSINENLLDQLRPEYVIVALNKSNKTSDELVPLENFHSGSQDYKLRHALKGSPFWGAYITDFAKGIVERNSDEVRKYLRKNPDELNRCVKELRDELQLLGVATPTFIALEKKAVYKYLKKHFPNCKVVYIPHYSAGSCNDKNGNKVDINNKSRYKDQVIWRLVSELNCRPWP
jgi:hypothetical protein